VTATSIAAANDLENREGLAPGEKLIIPAVRPAEETKSRLIRYRVRKGDTIGGIADQFSVTVEDIRKWNGLKSNKAGRGTVLRIYTLGGPEIHAATQRSHSSARKRKPVQRTN
jgi:LysM repeat protein